MNLPVEMWFHLLDYVPVWDDSSISALHCLVPRRVLRTYMDRYVRCLGFLHLDKTIQHSSVVASARVDCDTMARQFASRD